MGDSDTGVKGFAMDAARSICARATDNLAIFEARLMIQSRALRGPFISRIISVEKCEKIISCVCMFDGISLCLSVCLSVSLSLSLSLCALLTLLRPVVALGVLDVECEIGLTGRNHADGCCRFVHCCQQWLAGFSCHFTCIGIINFGFNFWEISAFVR